MGQRVGLRDGLGVRFSHRRLAECVLLLLLLRTLALNPYPTPTPAPTPTPSPTPSPSPTPDLKERVVVVRLLGLALLPLLPLLAW